MTGAKASSRGQVAVATSGLVKTYKLKDQDIRVLRGVDLTIRSGEFVSLMGPSGSGKSTLLNQIALLDTPTGGSVRILDQETRTLDDDARARMRREAFGFVFQSFNLVGRTSALKNVMLPLTLAGVGRVERTKRARELLERVGLSDRMENAPHELSGGQKQRVAIARALAADPPILLADEPTGALDSTTSTEIMALFKELNQQGRTVIQVTHDADMAAYGQRIIRVRDGLIEPPTATKEVRS